jgi:phosphatidate cytidylyltransferase
VNPPIVAAPGRWQDLGKRAASAVVLLPLAIFCLWSGGMAWAVLVLLGMLGLAWEWTRLTGGEPRGPDGLMLQAAVLGGAGLALLGQGGWGLIWVVGTAMATLLRVDRPVIGRFWLPGGVLYIGLAGLALAALRQAPGGVGLANVLFVLVVVWSSDIGAYVAGRWWGGAKLAPAISPGKTRSGAVGGLLAAMLLGGSVAAVAAPGGLALAVALAAALSIVSQAGDLFESWVKRRFRVKDSSALIPGHGGLLDRLDGLLWAAPVAALLGLVQGLAAGRVAALGEFLWR